VLFEAGGDCSEVLKFVEESLDEVSFFVKLMVDLGDVHAVRHGFDVGFGVALGQSGTQSVAVIGTIGEQGLVGPALSSMSSALRPL
jgi:hypothetical protein